MIHQMPTKILHHRSPDEFVIVEPYPYYPCYKQINTVEGYRFNSPHKKLLLDQQGKFLHNGHFLHFKFPLEVRFRHFSRITPPFKKPSILSSGDCKCGRPINCPHEKPVGCDDIAGQWCGTLCESTIFGAPGAYGSKGAGYESQETIYDKAGPVDWRWCFIDQLGWLEIPVGETLPGTVCDMGEVLSSFTTTLNP